MTEQNSASADAADQNSIVEQQVRPNELMEALGIKKDAYYAYLKFLGIKAQKDEHGKAYLELEQAERIQKLWTYVQENGKMEGFEETALATASETGMDETPPWEADPSADPSEFEKFIRQAQELAAQRMVMGDMVVAEVAQQMTYNDLSPDLKQKVDSVREATYPKANPAQIASRIMHQWRNQSGAVAA
jgi:hypothetical protein